MYLELDHLKKHFDGREVVRDLSLTLEQGQLLCILGASGCGKTTTLNMIGGFLEPDSGRVRLDGEDITRIPPEQRPVTTVFQSYGLFPHMTVQQRVALARALIVEPKLCLLDEPFCNLDAALRTRMRHELKRLQKDLGLTMVFVTHDQEEAIILADRIAIMDQGELVQNDAPLDLCRRPASPFVAEFMDLESLVWTEDGRLLKIIKR